MAVGLLTNWDCVWGVGGDFGVTLGALEVICVLFVKMKRNKVFLRYIDCIISVSAVENEGSIL